MKYRCDHCDEYHDIGDLTINIGHEGHKVIEDIGKAVMAIVEKRAVPYESLIYTLAAHLEQTKQVGLKLGNKSHRIEMIINVARNDLINDISIKKGQEKKKMNCWMRRSHNRSSASGSA